MSSKDKHNVTCPQCGHEQETLVWNSINVTRDPELKQKLFNGELNVFKCNTCKHTGLINAPLLYHDMERKYCVQYYPQESLKEDSFLRQFSQEGKWSYEKIDNLTKMLPKGGAYLATPHFVFDMNEMIRYIKFRDRLFDLHGLESTV